ncbi:MAG: hypothetical protein AB8G15_10140 [Saprospiraceae bacterium]
MLKRIFLLLSVVLLTASLVQAQKITEFSADSGEFLDQFEKFMTSSKQSKMEDAFEAFEDLYKAGSFTEGELNTIRTTSNTMLGLKMKASPYFLRYVDCLLVLKTVENGGEHFIRWHKILDQILGGIKNRKLKPYQEFLGFSVNFFQKKALRYSKSGVSWYTNNANYTLKYENDVPVIEYQKLDLIGKRKKDSIIIHETSGSFYPVAKIWKGKGGKSIWKKEEKGEEAFCELGEYEFEINKSLYEVKEAKLHYPALFPNQIIVGSLRDKILTQNKATEGSYPRFESRDSILAIDNIGGDLSYVGGFRLHGSTVYGFGSKVNKARISIRDQSNKVAYRGASELFVIRKGEKIVGKGVRSTIYFGQDSIYHPSVNLKFDIANKDLSLYRGKRGSDRNPFFNSLHQVNIDAENIDWLMNRDSIVIGKKSLSFGKGGKKATFESLKFFDEGDYQRLQNISTINPIATMKLVADQEGTNFLPAELIAKKLNPRFDVSSIQSLLYDLVSKGFIDYNSDKEMVELKDKVAHYADASQKKVDFDYLRIISKTDDTNAVFSLKDNSIMTNDVKNVEFSQTQKVALKPTNDQVILQKNRNMEFDGKLFAGYTTIQGKDFHYDYDQNEITLDSVRYWDFFIPTEAKDKNDNPISVSIASRVEHSTGVLLVDAPNNKSGNEDIPMFPSYNTTGPSYVYYDYKETKNGAYKRDSFYFELDKFNFNGLDAYTRDDLTFRGNMVSANIFPKFKEVIVLQEDDDSFGFETNTPAEGYPNYMGKGNYKGKIFLSNKGFLGNGNLTYLGASIDSEDIVFEPKRFQSTAEQFNLDEDRTGDPQYPQTLGLDVKIDWKPYKDSMYIRTKEKPFELFKDNNHTLKGALILTPGGLKGDGLFNWDKANMNSKLFSFGAYSTYADTASLKIRTFGSDDLAFDNENLLCDVDFDQQIGRFKSNIDSLMTTMPYNKYQTSLNEFTWNMKEETITFESEENKLGNFLSIDPNQDSLSYQGKTAFYDLKNNELKIGGVPFIQSCDALIYTETGDVEIKSGGIMTTLNNAKIIANTKSRYHVINRATVNVRGKKLYEASGFYEYNIGDKKQEIEFANIIGQRIGKGNSSTKETATRATGEVKEEDHFYIDHKTEFRGKISLNAKSKNLQFDGFARLDADKLVGKQWFSVSSEADKNDLAIEYDVPKNYDGSPLRTGLFLSKQTADLYPSVMMPLTFRKDRVILEAKGMIVESEQSKKKKKKKKKEEEEEDEFGFIKEKEEETVKSKGLFKYDKAADQFMFGDSLKIATGAARGNKLTFSNRTGAVTAEGTFSIGSGLDYVKVKSAGVATTQFKVEGDSSGIAPPVKLDLMAMVDFVIPDKLIKIMINDIKSSSFDAQNVSFKKNKTFEKALPELIDDTRLLARTIGAFKADDFDIPKKGFGSTIFFSQLVMKWNPEYQSFVSTENKVGVGAINGQTINKMLTCHVEFKMPSNGDDRVYIYIKSPSENYYFFGYKQGVLSTVSNNQAYNDEVLNLKKKEKAIKMDDGELYEIQEVNQSSASMFVNRAKEARK